MQFGNIPPDESGGFDDADASDRETLTDRLSRRTAAQFLSGSGSGSTGFGSVPASGSPTGTGSSTPGAFNPAGFAPNPNGFSPGATNEPQNGNVVPSGATIMKREPDPSSVLPAAGGAAVGLIGLILFAPPLRMGAVVGIVAASAGAGVYLHERNLEAKRGR